MNPSLRILFASLLGLLLILLPFTGRAQDTKPNTLPDKTARNQSLFQNPDIGAVYGQLFDSILTQLSKPEIAAKLARFQRQHFDALIKEGFTKEEALKIVISTPVPLPGSAK
jgi:hypothetical protein